MIIIYENRQLYKLIRIPATKHQQNINKTSTKLEITKTLLRHKIDLMAKCQQQSALSLPSTVSLDLATEETDKTPPIPPQHIYIETHHLLHRPAYLKLFTNKLFSSRIIILLITIFLFLLSLSYTFGQILSVELGDFWCKPVTLSQIRAHSKEIKSNTGASFSSCWTTKLNAVNYNINTVFCAKFLNMQNVLYLLQFPAIECMCILHQI